MFIIYGFVIIYYVDDLGIWKIGNLLFFFIGIMLYVIIEVMFFGFRKIRVYVVLICFVGI